MGLLRCAQRSAVIAALIGVAVGAAPARADLVLLARHPALGGPVLAGEEVVAGGTRDGRARLHAYTLGGRRRAIALPGRGVQVDDLAASAQALAVGTARPLFRAAAAGAGVPVAFGPVTGPLAPFPVRPESVAVSGSRVASIEHHRLVVRDVGAGGSEVLRRPLPTGAFDVRAAGGFAAVFAQGQIVVLDLATGAERYRVPAQVVGWGLGPGGRVVLLPVWTDVETILTATPEDTGLRPLARVDLVAPRVAVATDSIAVIRRAPRGLARVVIAGLDGSVRAVTPAFARVGELAYDGTTLAFNAGLCLYAFRVAGGAPRAAPDDGCSDIGATLAFGPLDRIGQRRGPAVRVPLRCVGPPVARCPARVTLSGPGFVTHRRFRVRPGLHVKRMPIPAGLRRRAWREGMQLVARDPQGGEASAELPR